MTTDRTDVPSYRGADLGNPLQPRWPARAQSLITNMHALCSDWLHAPLRQCLAHFEVLQNQSEQSLGGLTRTPRNRQQQLDEHKAFDQRFTAHIDKAFRALGVDVAPARPTPAATAPATLSLLDQVEHDLDGTLVQMVVHSEKRHGPLLLELGYRFAVLIGSAPLPSVMLPMGPQALSAAFRASSPALGLSTRLEVLLAQSFDTHLMQRMNPLYELINGYLRAEGILPNLHPFSSPRPLDGMASPPPPPLHPATSKVNLASASDVAVTVENAETDVAKLLSSVPTEVRSLHAASAAQLQDALSSLQRNFTELDEQLRRELRHPAMLQQEMLDQLNIDHSFGANRIELSAQQMQTIERVEHLFDAIVHRLPAGNGSARLLIEEMQLPMLRVALTDPGFFSASKHPARQWLADMVSAAHYWLDGTAGPQSAVLAKSLLALVARASNEVPDAALFGDLGKHLQHQLQPLQHSVEDAGQAQVQGLQDQDRLIEARLRADELLKRRCAGLPAGSPQRALLDQPWRDVLALSLLRHGENSEAFGVQLIIADQLVGRMPAGDRTRLQSQIEDGLRQIGMPRAAASALAQNAARAGAMPPAAREASSSASRLAMRLRQRSAPVAARNDDGAGDAAPVRIKPQHRDLHERLQKLPAQTWFEFAATATAPARRYWLAYCSPVSGRCLFVDHHGQPGEQLSLGDLAEAITSGRIRELASSQDVFDKAWRTLQPMAANAGKRDAGA